MGSALRDCFYNNMQKLYLRKIQKADIRYFAKRWRDKELLRLTSGIFDPILDDEVEKYFLTMRKSLKDFHYVILIGGRVVEHISLMKRKTNKYETQIVIGEKEYRGKGYGTKAIRRLIAIAKRRRIFNIYLEVRPTNLHAISAYENAGFSKLKTKKYPDNTYLKEVLQMELKIAT